jgi:hypothetical protein
MARYEDTIALLRERHGEELSLTSLDPRFVPFYNNGLRIRVREAGVERTGTVGISGGRWPTFMLMLQARSIASSVPLGKGVPILAVQRDGRYVRYIG